MRPTTILIAAMILTLCAVPAAAQTRAGMSEVGVEGAFDRANEEFGARASRINFDGSYGFFINRRLEIGPTFTFTKTPIQDAQSSLSGFVDVHIGDTSGRAVPYIEAAYGQMFGANQFANDPTFAIGAAGVKWFFGDGGGALNVSGFFKHTFFHVGDAPNFATGLDTLGAKVGVAIYFGR